MEIEQEGRSAISVPDYARRPHVGLWGRDLVGNLIEERHGGFQRVSHCVEQRISIAQLIPTAYRIGALSKSADAMPLVPLVLDERKIAVQGMSITHQPQGIAPGLGNPWNPQLLSCRLRMLLGGITAEGQQANREHHANAREYSSAPSFHKQSVTSFSGPLIEQAAPTPNPFPRYPRNGCALYRLH